MRHNSAIKAFYDKLVAAGKRKKVALVAAMRKPLGMLNAIAKHGSTWDRSLHSARLPRRLLSAERGSSTRRKLDSSPPHA